MKHFRILTLLAVSLCMAHSAGAQTKLPKEQILADPASMILKENTEVKHKDVKSGPIVINWKMKKLDGTANLVVNPDGNYVFSGQVKDKKKDRDFDVTLALKSNQGSIIVFHFTGNISNGVEWSKEGKSAILQDNFKNFAGKVDWSAGWTTPLTKEGLAKRYAEEEAKKKKLKQEALEKEEKEEAAAAQAKAQQQSSSDGSSVGSTIGTVLSVAAAVLAFF